MKFDTYELKEIIKYIERMINALVDRINVSYKKELPFVIDYKGDYEKYTVKEGISNKVLYLEYYSYFIYSSKDASFHPFRKPYLRMYFEIPYKNKLKERVALKTAEREFCERVIHELFAVMALGQGSLDFHGILNGTAELGVNDERTPLEIINGKPDHSNAGATGPSGGCHDGCPAGTRINEKIKDE